MTSVEYLPVVAAIIGAIVGAGSIGALFWKGMLPHLVKVIDERIPIKENNDAHEKLEDKIEVIEDKFSDDIKELQQKRDADFHRFGELGEDNQVIMSALKALLSHARTTNSNGLMAAAEAELDRHLIKNRPHVKLPHVKI